MKLPNHFQVIEENVSKGVACVQDVRNWRNWKESTKYVIEGKDGEIISPDVNSLNLIQLRDICDHRSHRSRLSIKDNATCVYEWDDEANNRRLTFTILAYISPYVPAKVSGLPEDCYPAEGGEMEDYIAILDSAEFYDSDGDLFKTLTDLNWREVMNLEKEFEAKIESDDKLQDRIRESCE